MSKNVSLLGFSGLVGVAFSGLISLLIWQMSRSSQPIKQEVAPDTKAITLLFRDAVLVDADNAIWELLDASDQPSWDDVRSALKTLVPDLPNALPKAPMMVPH